ncbi:unnamed protein product, partial [Closterium sp. NIES-53]
MFERRDIRFVGVLFQEYFSITLATCDGAVDYVGRMQEVADRLAARQAALSEPLQIHRLLFNFTPDYESRLHAFTEANPLAGLPEVTQWIIDTEVKLRTTTHSSTSLNATQPRTQGGRNGGGGGRGSSRGSGRGGRGGSGGGGSPGGPTPGGSSSAGGAVSHGGGRPGTLPPCTYVRRHGPHAGTLCGQTNHPPATCFKALDDAWFDRGNTGTPPRWNSVTPRPSLVDIQTLPSFLPAHLRLLTPSPPSQLQQFQQYQQQQHQYFPQQQQPQNLQQQQPPLFQMQQPPQQQFFQQQQPPQYLPPQYLPPQWQQQPMTFGAAAMAAHASLAPPLWGSIPSGPPSVPDSQDSFLGHVAAAPSAASMYPSAINETSFQYPVSPPLPSSPTLDF